jgi:CBS domain-containing protein
MNVKDIMTRDVEVVHPDDPIKEAAQRMRDRDIGFLPVCDGDRLVGVVTDRDLILRGLAEGTDPSTSVGRDLMTSPVVWCFDDQNLKEAAALMEAHQIRRVAVLRREDKRLVGVLSLGDIARSSTKKISGEVLESVSEPAG